MKTTFSTSSKTSTSQVSQPRVMFLWVSDTDLKNVYLLTGAIVDANCSY